MSGSASPTSNHGSGSHASNNNANPKVESFSDEHEAFAASRVSQYVFVPTKDIYVNTLDQHADTLEGDVKAPLVLVGNEGSGKSALLANWVAKRREHKHRDEFLFQHFVGCTTQSLELSHTLFRLETALKVFFQLREMKVPDTEVELRWSLNRFLEAASKKHSPARIVIIIDGVHRLQSEGTPDGTLYWLPTELPPCVRFIVSTVEYERNPKSKKDVLHSTFVELNRRQCPMLRIEPLGVPTRHSIISAFSSLFGSFDITEPQQFKIVTSSSTSQPMYLRSLLQALRLASSLTNAGIDDLLEKFLSCQTAHDLIDKNLNICVQGMHQQMIIQESMLLNGGEANMSSSFSLTEIVDEDNSLADLLGKIMSVVYASRSGLTEAEIWGLIRMVCRVDINDEQKEKLMLILKDYTMVVNDMYSFSHEIYREVAYSKYICSRGSLIRWHNVLARFFGQLPPCDRKLVALPYHLEMAGSWNKVKNCLTDIEMFQLWWTPKFKSDFIKFWASLTKIHTKNKKQHGSGSTTNSNGDASDDNNSHDREKFRPSYDVVEEYVKSLDEFRNHKHPSDEIVAGIILEIGDFLLEFATLGNENDADTPPSIHPKVLQEDLKMIGVPYIEIDEDGRSSLVYPEILHQLCNKQKTDDGPMMDAPTKAIEDVPVCTNYFYHRWMWIQFPFIALGNCVETRYNEGVFRKQQETFDNNAKLKKGAGSEGMLNVGSGASIRQSFQENEKRKRKQLAVLSNSLNRPIAGVDMPATSKSKDDEKVEMSRSWSAETFKLPEIKFNRKAARSVPRVQYEDEAKAAASKVQQRMMALQDNIQNYREEYDFVVQMKTILHKRLQDLKDSFVDLQRTAESVTQFDGALNDAIKRESEATKKLEKVLIYNKNLYDLSFMCDRHPANVPALITELQEKIEFDTFLISEMKKRLWEQRFERQAHGIFFKHMKGLVADSVEMHNKLLEYRYTLRKDLTQQAVEDERQLTLINSTSASAHKTLSKDHDKSRSKNGDDKNSVTSLEDKELEQQRRAQHWDANWAYISSRTGITEPEAFFQRMNNASSLEKQINIIKKTSESRLEMLKKEVVSVESELEEVRYEASFAGVQSSKEHKKQLAEKQQRLRQIKEKTEGMEQLEQKVVAGLAHISDILFIPKSEDDAPVSNLVRDIEAVLDTLINEREKQLQQQQGGSSSAAGGRDTSSSVIPETHANRSPELDFAIAKHESPKVRMPKRLPSRPSSEMEESQMSKYNRSLLLFTHGKDDQESTNDDDDQEDDGTWDRNFVKTMSLNSLKIEAKKGGKMNKTSPTN